MSLKIEAGGQTTLFRPSGEVATLDAGGQEVVRGAWRCAGGNTIAYTLDGAGQPPLAAIYRFNENNQLMVVVRDGAGMASDAEVFPGGIAIDDNHDLTYNLLDDAGNPIDNRFTVYGELRFEEDTNNLVVALAGGGETALTGDTGLTSLEAAQNEIAEFEADDLLRFRLTTINILPNGDIVPVDGKVEFVGSWDIRNGSLVFLSKVKGDITRPAVELGFAGRLGAVTAGFVYFADSAGTQAAFNIQGRHAWNAGNTKTRFNWTSSLGFSEKKFAAQAAFDVDRVEPDGDRLTLDGRFTLLQADGQPLEMSLRLETRYQWKDNALVFKAVVSDEDDNFNYDLMLEGRFKLDHLSIVFDIKYSNAAGSPALTFSLTAAGDHESLIKALSVHLRISDGEAATMIEGEAEIRMRFVSGLGRVLEQAAPQAAGTE